MLTKCSFDKTKDKFDYYRGKDCIEKLCKKLNKQAMKMINYEEKEMIPLTDEENKSYEKHKVCYICKNKFSTDDGGNKKVSYLWIKYASIFKNRSNYYCQCWKF